MIWVVCILIGIGLFFAFAGVVGVLRMPDTFCRMQSSTNITTLGVLGVILGCFLHAAFVQSNVEMAVKLVVLGVFYLLSTPISGHAMAKGAYWYGIKPKNAVCDQYREDVTEE